MRLVQRTMIFRRYKFLTIMFALGTIGAAWALSYRYQVETGNRAVEMVVDYAEVANLAGSARMTVPQVLDQLKQAGAISVAVQEETVGDLISSDQAQIKPDSKLAGTVIEYNDPLITERLRDSGLPMDQPVTSLNRVQVRINATPEYVLTHPVGLSPQAVKDVRQARMKVVARLVNAVGVDRQSAIRSASQLKRDGVRIIIFSGDQVLGFRGGLKDTADAFKQQGLIFGSVEFAKQKGDLRLSQLMLPNVIRVHSITGPEMGTLDRATAIERFVKAARERDIRLIYVRMFDFGDSNPLKTNLDYISTITRDLSKEGLTVKPAHPFDEAGFPPAAVVLIAIGAAAGAILLIGSVVNLGPGLAAGGFILVAIIFSGMVMAPISIGSKLVAFKIAIIFPTLAILYAAEGSPEKSDGVPLRYHIWQAVIRFTGAVMISGAGGLMIAGLLGHRQFMLRIDQFAGVKLAHLVPIMFAAIAIAAGIGWGPDNWKEQKDRAVSAVRKLAKQPILIWQAGLAVILLIMLAIVLIRSGNDAGAAVSGIELKFRALLDTILPVRPRTKEFLIGHPALFLGIAAALGGRRNLAAVLLVIGTIGEVSLVNTFCHIHTPIALSVMRVFIGEIIGLVIGIVLLLLFSRSLRTEDEITMRRNVSKNRVGVQK